MLSNIPRSLFKLLFKFKKNQMVRENWGSRFGFIMATAGFAIGGTYQLATRGLKPKKKKKKVQGDRKVI